ncbi:MAG: hypothetical protein ACRDUA_10325, partial [Micromonosporaceae bacterium]
VKRHAEGIRPSVKGDGPPTSQRGETSPPEQAVPKKPVPKLDQERAATLRSQVMLRGLLGHFHDVDESVDPLTRSLGGGMYEVLQLVTAGGLDTPDRSHFETWGDPDELFEAGRANVRAEPVHGKYDEADRVETLHNPDHELVAARVTTLGEGGSPAGYLVMMPDRHSLMFHQVSPDGSVFGDRSVGLYAAGLKAHAEVVTPFSDSLYWWWGGELTTIAVHVDGGQARIDVPPKLAELLDMAAPEPEVTSRKVRLPTTMQDFRQRVRVQVMRKADALASTSAEPVTRSLGADLVELLQFTVPDEEEDFVASVPWSYLEFHKANVDAVFDIARGHLRSEPVKMVKVDVRGGAEAYMVLGASSYVAAQVLLLGGGRTASPHGHLVMLPNSGCMLYHPIRDGQQLVHAFDMVMVSRQLREKMRSKGFDTGQVIGENPYWWHAGTLTEIPVSNGADGIRINAPGPFRAMARAIGADL